MTQERLLDFAGLCELLGKTSWSTINRWIELRGFPPGHMLGRRRIWTAREVLAWVEAQPAENRTPRIWQGRPSRQHGCMSHASVNAQEARPSGDWERASR